LTSRFVSVLMLTAKHTAAGRLYGDQMGMHVPNWILDRKQLCPVVWQGA